ncbi:MAG: D-Ala-D-Ala carboxypeptidase family metallohydrolase [Cyanobacteriota bacterium]|nr:D-Ala-D-Ala carboxypeptidase family metallohydrolase [Cyanobacteriota bacterium]
MAIDQVQLTDERWLDFWENFKGLDHQIEAVIKLGQHIRQADASLLTEGADWVRDYRDDGEPDWLAIAVPFVAEYEGFRSTAYLCPADVWTVGYGTTNRGGRPVEEGDTITEPEAARLLADDLERFHERLLELIPGVAGLADHQQAALVSWVYNVGPGAVEDSTLRKRVLDGEPFAVVVAEELPRWNKGGDGIALAGLTRRRKAEVALFVGKETVQTAPAKPAQETKEQPAKLSPASPFNARITPHIRLGEFALDQEARRFHHQYQLDTAAELAAFMEKCRAHFGGKPVVITSGYRPPAINKAANGASQSEHLFNAPCVGAADFYIEGVSVFDLQAYCDKAWPYSVGYGAPRGFVHLGIRQGRPRVRWDY